MSKVPLSVLFEVADPPGEANRVEKCRIRVGGRVVGEVVRPEDHADEESRRLEQQDAVQRCSITVSDF